MFVIVAVLEGEDAVVRARAALDLDHPGIAHSREIIELEGRPALVQDRVEGVALASSGMAPLEALDQALAALAHAHDRGVAHGDLRESDLWVTANGQLVIQRFGLTRPARPPAPRYDVIALSSLFVDRIASEPLRELLRRPPGSAKELRRALAPDVFARTTPTPELVRTPTPELVRTTPRGQTGPGGSSSARAELATRPRAVNMKIDPEALLGRTLGDFTITRQLRVGGLGMVFRASQPSLSREAVIKIPYTQTGVVTESLGRRFLSEARLASQLDHPYAAHIYAFGQEPDGLMWIAMELVNGTPLDDYIRQTGPMPPARAVAFVERLCQVVFRAHELQIVHRDIKPANVMVVQRSGRLLPKLLDFGIARRIATSQTPRIDSTPAGTDDDENVALTADGAIVGSPLYMAPEQWHHASSVGPAADIYALGGLTYELLSGRPPYKASSLSALAVAHQTAEIPSLPAGTPALDDVMRCALAKEPGDRYASALELGAALIAAAGGPTDAVALPRLADATRTSVTDHAPPPVAAAVIALDEARNVHQARDAVELVVETIAHWIGLVALSARSRLGAGGGDSHRATELVRELARRVLAAGEWVELAHELCASHRARPELHPIGELVSYLHERAAPLTQLIASLEEQRRLDEQQSRIALVEELRRLGSILDDLRFLGGYRVAFAHTSPRRDAVTTSIELWSGAHREVRIAAIVDATLAADDVLYVDADGAPVLKLHPLVTVAPPMPGQLDTMFMFAGTAGGHARMVAPPHGFTAANDAIYTWLGTSVLGSSQDLGRAEATERSPYRGLRAFTADDADVFVGREREIVTLQNRLRVQALIAVVGRSGCGKSSFVQAGLVPALGPEWRAYALRPGAKPLAALRAQLADAIPTVTPDDAIAAAVTTYAGESPQQLLVVVDQFEEVFTLCHDANERARFAAVLADMASAPDGRIRIVLTLRDDFLIATDELTALRDAIDAGVMLLATPGPAELERVLIEPAAHRGYTFDDPTLPRRMVADIAEQPGALALLSFAAAELWEHRDRHFHRLTRAGYDAMGGTTGALVGHAEKLLSGLAAIEVGAVREAFRRLVTREGTRAVVPRRELLEVMGEPARGERVLEKLVASRLIVASEGVDGAHQIEVAHETLLVAWPRLAEWRREDAEGARLHARLQDAATSWAELARSPGMLWRDDALAELRLWRSRYALPLTEREAAFADASEAHERRSRMRRRAILGIAFVTLIGVAVGLWVLATNARDATRKTRAQLVASYIEDGETKLHDGRRWKALASVAAAERLGASGPVVSMLRGLARDPARALEHRAPAHIGRIWSIDYSPDGRSFAVGGEAGASLWDASTGEPRATLPGHRDVVRTVAYSPDGKRIATISFDGKTRLFDAEGHPLATLVGDDAVLRCLAWSRDGRWLATGSSSGTLRVWDSASGQLRHAIASDGNRAITTCAFGRDRIAAGAQSGQILLVDPDTGASETLGTHADWTRSVWFDAAGMRLVTASSDRTARVWDVTSHQLIAELHGANDWLITAVGSPDGKDVVAVGRDGVVRVWDVASSRLRLALPGHHGVVWHVEYSRDGRRFLTSADDGSARVWDADTGIPLAVLEGHTAAILASTFSPDGLHAATGSYDGSLATWSVTAATRAVAISERAGARCMPQVSLDGRWLAIACAETVRLWDLTARRPIATLPGANVAAANATRAVVARGATASLYDTISSRAIAEVTASANITGLAINAERALIVDANGACRFVTLDGKLARQVSLQAPPLAFALLDGERWLVADGETLRLLDGDRELQRVAFATAHPEIVVSPTATTAAIIADRDVGLVDLAGTLRVTRLSGHQATIDVARFDASGQQLVTTSEDGGGVVWNVPRRALAYRLRSTAQHLADASFDASGLVYALDGTGSIHVFAPDGAVIGDIEGHYEVVNDGFEQFWPTPDGLAVVDEHGRVVVWQIAGDAAPLTTIERELACKAPEADAVGTCTR